ncbi:hypothetical protein [Nocardia aurantiaca]|uniref:Uncharacterized protein n=1 Tax=Nocardia aurantiaca TaxID=2675850 RepID=A0A6I3L7M6_9NOCA|nr:hypothetical protein [Nocardia aurantiaca]MTE15829.1 hypothetical protein [Nocardia aurantiaca]
MSRTRMAMVAVETFGVGKITTARELTELLPGSRILDTEEVGLMLGHGFGEWHNREARIIDTAAL